MLADANTIEALLRRAQDALRRSPSPRLDAEVLLAHSLGVPRSYLYAHSDEAPPDAARSGFDALLRRRMAGEPVAYITSRREFRGLDLEVSAATLIPRPDTELLVSLALDRIALDASCRVADLGTGSGAVALAIASERPQAEVWASDISEGAIAVARRNRDRLGLTQVSFVSGSWFGAFAEGQRFDVIAANPPYVCADDPHLGQGDLRFEPVAALVSGSDGLAAIRDIVTEALRWLSPGGWLLLEHGYDQGESVRSLLSAAGFEAPDTCRDLAGQPRVTLARAPSAARG